jgi:hypothetical protein
MDFDALSPDRSCKNPVKTACIKQICCYCICCDQLKPDARRAVMNKKELCDKIRTLYPDIGECGIDVNVAYDDANDRWTVHLKKDKKELKTFLEPDDADLCMEGKQCMSLGIEINQLKDSIDRMPSQ